MPQKIYSAFKPILEITTLKYRVFHIIWYVLWRLLFFDEIEIIVQDLRNTLYRVIYTMNIEGVPYYMLRFADTFILLKQYYFFNTFISTLSWQKGGGN